MRGRPYDRGTIDAERMRRLANTLTIVSVVLLLAVPAVWLTTRVAGHRAVRLSSAPGRGTFLVAGAGGVYVVTQRATLSADGSWTVDASQFGRLSVHSTLAAGGLVLSAPPTGPTGSPLAGGDGAEIRAARFEM